MEEIDMGPTLERLSSPVLLISFFKKKTVAYSKYPINNIHLYKH